jgi:hypothetical protein
MTAEIITSRVTAFCQRSGLSRSKVYLLMERGELESLKIDGNRLIVEESYRRLIERSRVAPKKLTDRT